MTICTHTHPVGLLAAPIIKEQDIRSIQIAGADMLMFSLETAYRYQGGESFGSLSELDHIWLRESDVVAVCPSPNINQFLAHSHLWQGVPDFVWIHSLAVKPVPFMEAIDFWARQSQSGDHWATLVIRELERLEEMVYNTFHGIEIPEEQRWSVLYRGDGGLRTLSNDSSSVAPVMYRPGPISGTVVARLDRNGKDAD
jgi:hypothetical protein